MYYLTKFSIFIHLSQAVLWYGTAVCLSIQCPSIHPSIHPFTTACQSVYLSVCPSVRPSCLSLSIQMYVHEFYTPSQVVLWNGTAVCLSVHPCIHLFTSACPSVHPSVCPTKLTRPDLHHVVGLFILRDVCLSILSISIQTYVHEFDAPITGCIMVWRCCLSFCPSIHPSVHVCLSVHLSICPYVCLLSICLAAGTDIYTWVLYTCHRLYYGMALLSVLCASNDLFTFACLSVLPSAFCLSLSVHMYGAAVCLPVHPSIRSCLSFHPSICPSSVCLCLYIRMHICRSVHPSNHPCVYISVSMPVCPHDFCPLPFPMAEGGLKNCLGMGIDPSGPCGNSQWAPKFLQRL